MVEFALAVTLLTGAGLMILSFWNRTRVDLGIRTDHILTFGLPVNNERFPSAAEIDGFYRQLLECSWFDYQPQVPQQINTPGWVLLVFGIQHRREERSGG